MFKEIESFFEVPIDYRYFGLSQKFTDIHAYDGEVYKRVCMLRPNQFPEVTSSIEKVMGPILMLGLGYRLNWGKELPNHSKHVDTGWGTHALVCYLSTAPKEIGDTGTAFWSSTEDDAEMVGLCREEFGKAVIYRSDQPHSRWPLEAYGNGATDGRLVLIAFFTPISELK